jgi:hypothetical protein
LTIEGRDDVNDDAAPTAARMNWGDKIRKMPRRPGSIQRRLAKLAAVDLASLLRFEKATRTATSTWSRRSSRCSVGRRTNPRLQYGKLASAVLDRLEQHQL